MVIKSYVAPSVAGALKMIRAELGSKAVVLKTRGLTARESGVGRRMVEITACLEKPSVGVLSASLADPQAQSLQGLPDKLKRDRNDAPSVRGGIESPMTYEENLNLQLTQSEGEHNPIDLNDPLVGRHESMADKSSGTRSGMVDIHDMELFAKRLEEKLDLILDTHLTVDVASEVPEQLAPVARLLAAHDIPERFARTIIKSISEKMASEPGQSALECAEEVLTAEFAKRCEPELLIRPGDVVLFIGPAGSGKTSVLGKVAVELLFKRRIKTELSTLDDFRIAAQEEIASYGEALGASFVNADDIAATLQETLPPPERALLVDCHSNINDQRQFMRLKERATALKPNVVFLVISALTRSADISRLVRRFEQFNPTHIIATHTDLTDIVGGVYTAACDSALKVCALTNSPGSLGDMLAPDPGAMARRILKGSK